MTKLLTCVPLGDISYPNYSNWWASKCGPCACGLSITRKFTVSADFLAHIMSYKVPKICIWKALQVTLIYVRVWASLGCPEIDRPDGIYRTDDGDLVLSEGKRGGQAGQGLGKCCNRERGIQSKKAMEAIAYVTVSKKPSQIQTCPITELLLTCHSSAQNTGLVKYRECGWSWI